MIALTAESCREFFEDVNYFGGGNVKSIEIDLSLNNEFKGINIRVEVQLECSERVVVLEMIDVKKYRISDMLGYSMFGMMGHPYDVGYLFIEDSVLVFFGECLAAVDYENIVKSDFFIQSRQIYAYHR